jgi:hypothetical protein
MNATQREINNMANLLDEQQELVEQLKTDHEAAVKPMTASQAVKQAVESQGYRLDSSYVNTGGVRRMRFVHPTTMKELRISVEESMAARVA